MNIKNNLVCITFVILGMNVAFSQTFEKATKQSMNEARAAIREKAKQEKHKELAALGGLGGALGGALGSKASPPGEGNAGGFNIAQLTPGGIKLLKAYGYYAESYDMLELATKVRASAQELENGGTFTKAIKTEMDNARKELTKKAKGEKGATDQQKELRKKGSDLVKEAVVEWGIVAATVSVALSQDPKAALTNPELGIAAALCVKGLADQTKLMTFVLGKDREEKKERKMSDK